ncbi:MAG: hypothetical protein HRU13_11985 [Phycisphaerales bacterium]|nr:hypothetical protein [Phycisphaerales bacterium]
MAGPAVNQPPSKTSPLATLGWGFYLAVSWTWIIGMILPALLLRDLGWWALAVFLAPNAIGAALMGMVLRDAQAALRLRQQHDAAIRRFSMVTIAFHLYVLTSIALAVEGLPSIGGQASVLIIACVLAVAMMAVRRWLITALAVWVASIGLAIAFVASDASVVLADPGTFASAFPQDLLLLTPVVVFGFALCPYLDATFLRARASTGPTAGKAAFAFGFLVPFVIMIAFTVIYAAALVSGHAVGWALILAHLAVQGGFTLAVHLRESKLTLPQRGITLGLTIAALAASWSLPAGRLGWAGDMLAWEVVYRLFLSAYGLFFPAYVLFAMVPSALGMGPMPSAGRAVTAITIAAVLPLYGLGFIALEEQWLPLALGLVLAGAFITFALRRRATEASDG